MVLHRTSAVTEREMLDWCAERIVDYKRPRSIAFIDEVHMPRTATGKILHRTLRDRWLENSS